MPAAHYKRPDLGILRLEGVVGTAGCVVKKRSDGDHPYLLSNAHVMAWTGNAEPSQGDLIFIRDEQGHERPIAKLEAWSPKEGSHGPQRFDAAIARFIDPTDTAIERIGRPRAFSSVIDKGMKVHMTGARSGSTQSVITDPTFDLELKLERCDGLHIPFTFNPLILCEPFNDHGDSGAAVYDARDRLIGLISAMSSQGSVFCRADLIFEAFGLTV